MTMSCKCCGKQAVNSIQVMEGSNNPPNRTRRYYLPNKANRDDVATGFSPGDLVEFPLCPTCMRAVEDNFRATILYLQAEAGKVSLASEP